MQTIRKLATTFVLAGVACAAFVAPFRSPDLEPPFRSPDLEPPARSPDLEPPFRSPDLEPPAR